MCLLTIWACLLCANLPQACQAALAIQPDYYDATKELIRALLAAERFEEAVNLARNTLQQHQQDGEMHQVRWVLGLQGAAQCSPIEQGQSLTN